MVMSFRCGVILAAAAAFLLGAATVPAGPEGAPGRVPADGSTVDERTAQAYEQFRQRVLRRFQRAAERMEKRYELDDRQRQLLRQVLRRSAQRFLRRHGREAFALMARGRALGELLRQERVGWEELPEEVKRDLAERALPLLGWMERESAAIADSLADELDQQQRRRLAEDRARMAGQLRAARLRVEVLAGRAPPPGAEVVQPKAPASRPGRRRARHARPRGLDRWEAYVRQFIRRHRLDEVQKLQAMELLAKYKAKARVLSRAAASRPASRPATGPASRAVSSAASRPGARLSMADFRRRLEELRRRRRLLRELFERLKAELDKIPTPVQRQLAE